MTESTASPGIYARRALRRIAFYFTWHLDPWLHKHRIAPRWVCTLYDYGCGMSWKEARS